MCAVTTAFAPRDAEPSNAARELAKNYVRDGWRLVAGQWMQPAAVVPWSQIVRVETDGPMIRIVAAPSERLEQIVRGDRVVLIDIPGSSWAWMIDFKGRVWNPARTAATQNLRVVAASDEPGSPICEPISLRITPDAVVVEGSSFREEASYRSGIVFDSDGVRVQVTRQSSHDKVEPLLNEAASNLFEIERRSPRLFRQFVRPVFTELAAGRPVASPGAADVYAAFDEPLADESMVTRVRDLCLDLANPRPDVRERAAASLEALGNAGVLAAMRLDRSLLPPAAARSLDVFVDSHRRLRDRTKDDLLADPFFLIDCLSFADATVPQLARDRLRERFEIEVKQDSTLDDLLTAAEAAR